MSDNHENDDAVSGQLQALGYIDPGTGSSFFQLFLAAIFKISSKIKRIFRGAPKKASTEK